MSQHTPIVDAFVANKLPDVIISNDLERNGMSARAALIAWAEFARSLERDRAELLSSLKAVVSIADRDTDVFIAARALLARLK